MDGKEIYQKTSMLINYSKFGADSWQNIYENERKTTTEDILQYISSRSNSQRSRKKRNSLSGKKGVMYVSLDAGGGGESCPSLADSAAVSLSQMAFLSMSVSIFSVVANIANNLNNNNNNQNDNNLNYVHQQNNNLNMNQNIVNQLNIDLPPPIPGKRSVSETDRRTHHQKLRQMLNISSERSEDDGGCGSVEDVTKVAIKALMDIIKITVYNGVANDWSLPCLGKILCLVTEEQQAWPHDGEDVWSSMLTLHTAGLAYLMLDNHNSDFQLFLQHFTTDQYQLLQQKLNCSQIFTDCFI